MLKPFAILSVLALVTLAGCKQVSSQGGGMKFENSFRIIAPYQLNVPQGAVQTIYISLYRGDDFKQDVKLKLKAPSGINVDPSSLTIKSSAGPDTLIKVSADKDAALGEYHVMVTGTPENGEPVSTDFGVKVVAP